MGRKGKWNNGYEVGGYHSVSPRTETLTLSSRPRLGLGRAWGLGVYVSHAHTSSYTLGSYARAVVLFASLALGALDSKRLWDWMKQRSIQKQGFRYGMLL